MALQPMQNPFSKMKAHTSGKNTCSEEPCQRHAALVADEDPGGFADDVDDDDAYGDDDGDHAYYDDDVYPWRTGAAWRTWRLQATWTSASRASSRSARKSWRTWPGSLRGHSGERISRHAPLGERSLCRSHPFQILVLAMKTRKGLSEASVAVGKSEGKWLKTLQ